MRRLQDEIAARRECDPRRVEMPEIVVVTVRMLRRLGRIDRHPHSAGVELRPAVVAGNIAGLRCANRKANREARRDSAGARESDEQRMEVSAVAAPDVASIERVATAPTSAALVVLHD